MTFAPHRFRNAPAIGRTIRRGLTAVAVLGLVALALTAFAAWLIHGRGPSAAALATRDWMAAVRPVMLAVELGAVAAIWWFWQPLVRRAKFPPAVEDAWLAARHRLALWAIALVLTGVALCPAPG